MCAKVNVKLMPGNEIVRRYTILSLHSLAYRHQLIRSDTGDVPHLDAYSLGRLQHECGMWLAISCLG